MFKKLVLATLTCTLVFSAVNMGDASAYTRSNNSQVNVQSAYRTAIKLSVDGKNNQALAVYQSILRVDPNHAMAINNIGYIYSQQGKRDLAIQHYRRAINLRPNDDTFHSNLASCLAAKGEYDEAIAEYNRALEIDPGSITVKNALDKVIQKSGRYNYQPRNTNNSNPTVSNVVPIYSPNFQIYPYGR